MAKARVIPLLLLRNGSLVKTKRFGKYEYIGDPCNTVRIFNELEVDELIFLDILASRSNLEPNFKLLQAISEECFMPLTYGGGIKEFCHAKEIFRLGFEKVSLNSALCNSIELLTEISDHFGVQATIASLDYTSSPDGSKKVVGRFEEPAEWAQLLVEAGAGEILLTSVEREGTWSGLDLEMIRKVSSEISVPLIAHGGTGSISDIEAAFSAGAAAVAVGSFFMFYKKDMGVLVNVPEAIKGL